MQSPSFVLHPSSPSLPPPPPLPPPSPPPIPLPPPPFYLFVSIPDGKAPQASRVDLMSLSIARHTVILASRSHWKKPVKTSVSVTVNWVHAETTSSDNLQLSKYTLKAERTDGYKQKQKYATSCGEHVVLEEKENKNGGWGINIILFLYRRTKMCGSFHFSDHSQ